MLAPRTERMVKRGRLVEGRWRILETDMWDQEALDLVVPAHITFTCNGLGDMQLIAIGASIDYRVEERDGAPMVEFSWSGFDEMDPMSGRAWATVDGDTMRGKLFIHQGDESSFTAKRERAGREVSGANRPLQPPAAAPAQRVRTRQPARRGRG